MAENANPTTAPPPKRRRWLRNLSLLAGMFVLLVVALYFVATSSGFLQGVILPRAGKAMNATLTVSDASIHPFREVVLHNFKVQTTGDEPLVMIQEVRARYSLRAILGGTLSVEEVTISSPTISLVENPDGSSNLDPILRSQKEKPTEPKPATSTSSSSRPPQVDLKKFALTDATVRRTTLYAGGKRDTMEVSHINVRLDGLKNGQAGKLALSADLKVDNNPPSGTNGSLQASLKGSFDFSLTPELKPGSVKGNTHLAVARAEGALSDLALLSGDLDCELSPTEIKQLALHFQKDKARLGEVTVSGPFDVSKGEGRLAVQILSIDRQALNLAGAGRGMDFGPSTINSTNEIVLTKGGDVINASGQLIVGRFQITKAGETTPAVNLQANYNASLDKVQHSVAVTGTTLALKVDLDPPLEAKVQIDASVQNQVAEIRRILLSLAPTSRAKNELELKGRLDLTKPDAIQGNLNLTSDALDLTSYYDSFAKDQKQAASKPTTAASPTAPSTQPGKEPEPTKLPFKDFVAGIDLHRVYLREVDIAGFQVQTKITGGQVAITPCKLSLNGAPVNSSVDLDLGVPGYKYSLSFSAQAIPLAPLVNSFQPERKGQIGGTLTANARISGVGTTPASLQKNLAGQFDVGTTNLNLAVANAQNRVLKALLQVVVMIPELVRSPEVALTSLVGSLAGKLTGSRSGESEELSKSPIDTIVAKGGISAGQVNLENALVQSPAFQAAASGTVTMADPPTNSILLIPISISLPRSLASSLRLAPASGATNTPYVKLPDFLTMKGTVGDPKTDIKKLALAGAALQGIGGAIPLEGTAGSILKGIGGLLQGGTNSAGTNSATGAKTNSSGGLLDRLLKPKQR